MNDPRLEPSYDATSPLEAGPPDAPSSPHAIAPRERIPSWFERLLDPRALQGLMLCGGGLLVLGLVLWLWTQGIFENPLTTAVCLGATNGSMLALGGWMLARTRYQLSGRGIALLACLLMPLHLWFYDAQGLVTLAEGGRLWVPAVAMCVIYVATAILVRDPSFVYAIVGGISLAGLLLLADRQVGRFWEILTPSAFLVIWGSLCIHAERLFPANDGPFSRQKFGRTFFEAGHLVMAAGLGLLVGGHLLGVFYDRVFADWGVQWLTKPAIASEKSLKMIALVVGLAAGYSYIYSRIVVAAKGRYSFSAVLTLLWSGLVLLDLMAISLTLEHMALALAIAGLARELLKSDERERDEVRQGSGLASAWPEWDRPLLRLRDGAGETLLPAAAVLGLLLTMASSWSGIVAATDYRMTWLLPAALFATAGGGGWSLFRRSLDGTLSDRRATSLGGTMVLAGTLFVLAVGNLAGPIGFDWQLLVAMSALTVAALLGVRLQADIRWKSVSRGVDLSATMLALMGAVAWLEVAPAAAPSGTPLVLAAVLGLAGVTFVLSGAGGLGERTSLIKSVLCGGGSAWLVLDHFAIAYPYLIASSLGGLVLVGGSRLMGRHASLSATAVNLDWAGCLLTMLGAGSGIALTTARLLTDELTWDLVPYLALQAIAAAAVCVLTRNDPARRPLASLSGVGAIVAAIAVNALSPLSFGQRAELLLTCCGILLLGTGLWGWRREQQTGKRDELVSWQLALGSCLAMLPMTLGLLLQRLFGSDSGWAWVAMHEIGALAFALLLLGCGVVCRIRSATLTGATGLAIYLVSLLGLLRHIEQLQSTSVYLMAGGGLFFLSAVLMAAYRERLLALHEEARAGKGIFSVLRWR